MFVSEKGNIDWTQAVFKVQDGRYSCIGRYNSLEVFIPYWNLEQTIKGYNPKPLQKVRGVGLDAISVFLQLHGNVCTYDRNICKCTTLTALLLCIVMLK